MLARSRPQKLRPRLRAGPHSSGAEPRRCRRDEPGQVARARRPELEPLATAAASQAQPPELVVRERDGMRRAAHRAANDPALGIGSVRAGPARRPDVETLPRSSARFASTLRAHSTMPSAPRVKPEGAPGATARLVAGRAGSRYQQVALPPSTSSDSATARLRSILPRVESGRASASCSALEATRPGLARHRSPAATAAMHLEHCGRCSWMRNTSALGILPCARAASVC